MTITIYGAGAIGGLAGAYLAKAGEDVLLVDKVAEHVDAINRRRPQDHRRRRAHRARARLPE